MKKIAIAAAASSLLAACATTPPPSLSSYTVDSGVARSPDQLALSFEKADLNIRVMPATRSIQGDARLTFGTREPVDRIELDLDRNLPIEAIEVDGQALASGSWSNPEGRLTVRLPQRLEPGKQTTIRVRYHGTPHVAKNAPWDGGFVWSKTPDGQPWVASAVQGEGCDLFWPCIDHPTGKPKQVDQHFTVPAPLVAAGAGVAMGMDEKDGWRTWHWSTKNPSTYGISVNVGPYKLMEGNYASRYGNKYAKTQYGYDELLQHELAHEWFGNQLTNADWDDMWLHEGLGTYMQPLYMQYLRGQQAYFAELMAQRAGIQNKAPIVSGKPRTEGQVYSTERGGPGQDIYTKGALVMHTLRGVMGDEAFFRTVRESVYGTPDPRPGNFQPRLGTTKEFMEIAKRVSGRDLDWFFQAYLYQAALPDLQATRNGNTLNLAWKTEKDTPFPMPVEVRVGERIVNVPMTDGRGSVQLEDGAHYVLDPNSKILRREQHIERYQAYREEQRKKRSAAK